MYQIATTEWAERVFGSWEAYRASLPPRLWYPTLKGWASHDRHMGLIEPGTAKRKAEEAREQVAQS